jgi:hypothetical protein
LFYKHYQVHFKENSEYTQKQVFFHCFLIIFLEIVWKKMLRISLKSMVRNTVIEDIKSAFLKEKLLENEIGNKEFLKEIVDISFEICLIYGFDIEKLENSLKMLERFVENQGNFIDNAQNLKVFLRNFLLSLREIHVNKENNDNFTEILFNFKENLRNFIENGAQTQENTPEDSKNIKIYEKLLEDTDSFKGNLLKKQTNFLENLSDFDFFEARINDLGFKENDKFEKEFSYKNKGNLLAKNGKITMTKVDNFNTNFEKIRFESMFYKEKEYFERKIKEFDNKTINSHRIFDKI